MVKKKKNQLANVQDVRDAGSIPGLRRSSGGGHGNPLQYSCLENPMDKGAWWATVHRVSESDTTEAHMHTHTLQGHTESSTSFQPAEVKVKVLWTFQTPSTLEASV